MFDHWYPCGLETRQCVMFNCLSFDIISCLCSNANVETCQLCDCLLGRSESELQIFACAISIFASIFMWRCLLDACCNTQFLVACSDSISHYVCPSVGPSVTHLLFSLFDHAWGPQSHCLGQSSCFWSHWSQFQMNSLWNFKKSKNFQKFKIQKSEVLGQRMCSKCLSMLSQHWSPP